MENLPVVDMRWRDVPNRIGTKPRDQLKWALRIADLKVSEMTEGDRANFLIEIQQFADEQLDAVRSKDWAREIIENFRLAIERALDRQGLDGILRRPKAPVIGWNKQKGRFEPRPAEGEIFETTIINQLGKLILDCGHLLKRCEAPAKIKPGRKPRNGSVEEASLGKCGKEFVAIKDTQLYCTAACLDRALTRRAEQPKVKKKRDIALRHGRRTKSLARTH